MTRGFSPINCKKRSDLSTLDLEIRASACLYADTVFDKMYELEKERYLGNTKRSFTGAEGLSVIETEYHSKVFEGWHSHENAHITLFLKGGTLEKRKQASHTVSPGSILFYHSDELHLNSDTQFPSVNINIEIEAGLLREFELTEALLDKAIADNAQSKFMILKMYRECLQQDTYSSDSIRMLFAQLSGSLDHRDQFQNAPRWVKHLYELLNDRWNENPNLKQLAGILAVNHITISKHFPRYFGCTLGEYMRRLKVNRSLALIQNPALSLTDVGMQCGFADQSHFIRIFKEQTGFLPRQFQKL